jgi:hypothetical protein
MLICDEYLTPASLEEAFVAGAPIRCTRQEHAYSETTGAATA